MNNLYHKGRLETVIIAFFVLALLFALAVYLIDPSIYTKTLLLEPSSADRYPYPATLFLVCLVVFIAILSVGVVRHWSWMFWLLLVAFGFSILQVPVTILQLTGIFPDPTPVWYSLLRMGIAMIEIGIAVWMIQIYRHHGVWQWERRRKQACNDAHFSRLTLYSYENASQAIALSRKQKGVVHLGRQVSFRTLPITKIGCVYRLCMV